MGEKEIDYDKDLLNYYINLFRDKFADVPQISTHDYHKMLKKGVRPLVLDARSQEEYRYSWLKGAIWCPDTVTDEKLTDFLSKYQGEVIICHCGAGGRGNVLAQRVEELVGKSKKVYNLEGGVFAWVNEGRLLVGTKGVVYRATELHVGVLDRVTIGPKPRVYVDSVNAAKMVKPDVVFIPQVVWSML